MLQRIESGNLALAYHGLGCAIRFLSPTSTVRIHFTSDYIVRHSGFKGTYRSNVEYIFNCKRILYNMYCI